MPEPAHTLVSLCVRASGQPGVGGRHVWPGAQPAQGAGGGSSLSSEYFLPFRLARPACPPGLPAFSAAHPRLSRAGRGREGDPTCPANPQPLHPLELLPHSRLKTVPASMWPALRLTIMAACTGAGSMRRRRMKSWSKSPRANKPDAAARWWPFLDRTRTHATLLAASSRSRARLPVGS